MNMIVRCPYCGDVAVFLESCDSNAGDAKLAYTCYCDDACDNSLLLYVYTSDR